MALEQRRRRNALQQLTADPVGLHDPGIQRIGDGVGRRDQLEVGPRPAETPRHRDQVLGSGVLANRPRSEPSGPAARSSRARSADRRNVRTADRLTL